MTVNHAFGAMGFRVPSLTSELVTEGFLTHPVTKRWNVFTSDRHLHVMLTGNAVAEIHTDTPPEHCKRTGLLRHFTAIDSRTPHAYTATGEEFSKK